MYIFLIGCVLNVLFFLLLSYLALPLASPALQNYYILKDYINQTSPKNKKRLIIMSASDGMYGFTGDMIDQETSYFPINYSMFFGTGIDLEFRINKLILSLKDGDTILLPLHYSFYTTKENPCYYSYYQNMLSWGDGDFFKKHPILTFQTLFKSPPSKIPTGLIQHLIAHIKKKHILDKAQLRWKQKNQVFNGVNTDSIDQYGELQYHQGTLPSADSESEYIGNDFEITPYFLGQYKKLKKYCDQHNITILFTYSPMLKNTAFNLDTPQDSKKIQNFKEKLAKHGITILGDPKKFQFSLQDFYDSPSHLNTSGAIKYTKEIIKILNTRK